MTSLLSNESLHFYLTEPVSHLKISLARALAWAFGLRAARSWFRGEPMFAHVLNVPDSEEVWPGDALNVFILPTAFFEVRPDTGEYVNTGLVSEHMRCETLRLCSPDVSALDHMKDQLDFYLQFDGPFPKSFCDGSDDEVEPFYYPEDFA